MLARFTDKPVVTLAAVLGELKASGIRVGLITLWRFFKRQGVSFKKTMFAIDRNRPDWARKHARWKKYQGKLDPARLVFIDETWAKTKMIRSHVWCARGKPLNAKASLGH